MTSRRKLTWGVHLCGDQHLAVVVNQGPNPVPGRPLPWTGDFHDGLGNKISIMACANPTEVQDEKQRADGYGTALFNKKTRQITYAVKIGANKPDGKTLADLKPAAQRGEAGNLVVKL